jgi:hypothetical protein
MAEMQCLPGKKTEPWRVPLRSFYRCARAAASQSFMYMPHLFRSSDDTLWKPASPIPLELADGTKTEGIWAGSAQDEKLAWWLRNPGNQLAQSGEVAEIAIEAEDTKEMIWGPAPAGARLLFVLEAAPAGKNYRLAKMVTTAADDAQIAYFRHHRFSLFGSLNPDGSIARIPPVPPPPPTPPAQGELF